MLPSPRNGSRDRGSQRCEESTPRDAVHLVLGRARLKESLREIDECQVECLLARTQAEQASFGVNFNSLSKPLTVRFKRDFTLFHMLTLMLQQAVRHAMNRRTAILLMPCRQLLDQIIPCGWPDQSQFAVEHTGQFPESLRLLGISRRC